MNDPIQPMPHLLMTPFDQCSIREWHHSTNASFLNVLCIRSFAPHEVNLFFVNLSHSPGVWFFDIWYLFDNLTSFWQFDTLLKKLQLITGWGFFFKKLLFWLSQFCGNPTHFAYHNFMGITVNPKIPKRSQFLNLQQNCKWQKFSKGVFWWVKRSSTNHQLTLHPYHWPFMTIFIFLFSWTTIFLSFLT